MSRIEKILKGKQAAICGVGKFQEDFEYVFDTIKPQFYISDDFGEHTYHDLPVYKTCELKELNLSNILIIVCDLSVVQSNEKNRDWNRLEEEGYQWGTDFIFADELFSTLDFDWQETADGRKIAFWGTGADSRKFYISNKSEETNLKPNIFIDMDKSKAGKLFHGVEIVHPEQLADQWEEYYVVVMTDHYYHEVYEYLITKGLNEIEDFVSYRMIYDRTYALPSEMMRKTVYSVPIEGQPFCESPFKLLQLCLSEQAIGCCCPMYVDPWWGSFGNYRYEPCERIWNSPSAKIFRLSILNNTFCFCIDGGCEVLNPGRKENPDVERKPGIEVKEYPSHVFSEMDDVCNLRCPSCRLAPKYLNYGREYQVRRVNAEKLIRTGWLEKADVITVAGHGEVFYSKIHRSILYHDNMQKRNHIIILSNGNLFNETEFMHVKQNYKNISITISIDGTDRETYEKLRPGSNFKTLMKNMEMLSEHRRKGDFQHWQINFVVQRENYLQMKDMVRLVEEWGVDRLNFIHILNWLYSPDKFDRMSMSNQDGSLKPELMEYLDDPIFDNPIVNMAWFKKRMGSSENENGAV